MNEFSSDTCVLVKIYQVVVETIERSSYRAAEVPNKFKKTSKFRVYVKVVGENGDTGKRILRKMNDKGIEQHFKTAKVPKHFLIISFFFKMQAFNNEDYIILRQ